VKTAVIVFPGSNCDRDMAVALEQAAGRAPAMVWHQDSELPAGTDFVALPGGFSYGDYLRSGAMAARSPIMAAVKDAAARGVPVLGVCNGFQILTEAGLLPGASAYQAGEMIQIPVAHHDGNYFADAATLDMLEGEGRVAFRYLDSVNGSARDIAGVLNAAGNVLGMMPHPERACDPAHGNVDGARLFKAAIGALVG
jgi:phosphoribosylformylglycinamidine synthase subunit PurQ / glutaminase